MKLLLLAGTSEARALAGRLADDPRVSVIASLAGATRDPAPLPVETRIGGFGGAAAQEEFMKSNGIEVVIDATHPFASRISHRTQAICDRLGLPWLQILRPGWQPVAGDRWRYVDDAEGAAQAIPQGAVAFAATGRQTLAAFAKRADVTLYLRQIDPPSSPFPLPTGGYVVGTPPFSIEDEMRLFKDLGVDVLVVKDAGGRAGSKLDAARALGLPVIVIRRPGQPPGDKVASVAEALGWLERRL
ncbi:cobalt-precorrin-6A reductase [Sinisalibacter aestuarii]|uniref:Precorrin-6A reductase n=1 Tax=Sinisalibacter aestuarii TaxID=2949426 RepID=A0ABQ5LTG0_9RHOB|nr:cobalt-precorrin-6A reductase [Sinisalibacter aestuarii]GKY87903.1 precorrin-6A reductase [Sinisalibacter aestuarii]